MGASVDPLGLKRYSPLTTVHFHSVSYHGSEATWGPHNKGL